MIPEYVNFILFRLRQAGHKAYVVGGCVRDILRGVAPHDWDVCTSAKPVETERIFLDLPRIDTGRKHGTIAVVAAHKAVEITTFRADGTYLDNRHPSGVTFLPDLSGDLSRRDFTINAMALDEEERPIDLFGGHQDLQNHILLKPIRELTSLKAITRENLGRDDVNLQTDKTQAITHLSQSIAMMQGRHLHRY